MPNKDEIKKILGTKIAPLAVAAAIGVAPVPAMATTKADLEKAPKKISSEEQEQISKESEEYPTREEAENWVENEENNLPDDYEVENKGVIETEKQEIERVKVSEEFSSEEEANDFIKENEDKDNFTVTQTEKYSDWEKTETTTEKETGLASKEEADQKANELTEKYKSEETDTVKYEVTITETQETERVFVRETTTSKTSNFDTLEEAETYIENLKLEENEDVTITVTGPQEKQVVAGEETDQINQTFASKEEAEQFIQEYEDLGYEVSNISIEEKTTIKENKIETGEVIVKSQNKLDSNSRYEVEGNYIMLKQASSHVAIWTEEELSEEQKQSFEESWKQINNDGSIQGQEIVFISGTGSKDLSSLGNQWGTYNITTEDGKIIMTCDKNRISHLNYGSFEKQYKIEEIPETSYEASADIKKTIYKQVFEVKEDKTVKEYEEQTTYGYEAQIDKFEREKTYLLTGSYDEIKNTLSYKGFIEARMIKELTPNPREKVSNIDSPQTADSNNINLALAGMGLGLAGLAGVELERRKNKTRVRK